VEGDFQQQDRRFAEWYAWAKREVSTDGRVCLGAAQAALEALEDGGDEDAARRAARGSTAGHGIALVSRIAPRRRAYAEWYDWARREIGGPRDRLHTAAEAAMGSLDAGGDAGQAAAAARAAVATVPPDAGAPSARPPGSWAPPGAAPAAPIPRPAPIPPPAPAPPPAPPPAGAQPEPQAPAEPSPRVPGPPEPAAGTAYRPPAAYGPAPPFGPAPASAQVAPPQATSPPYGALPQPPQAPSHAYAGIWRRGAAWLIDAVLLTIGLVVLWFFLVVFAFLGLASSGQDITDSSLTGVQLGILLIALVLVWLYYAGLESSVWQGTIGKRLMQLLVTDVYGRRIGFGQATGRYFGKIVSFLTLGVGYLMIAFTERRQGLHDLMAGTLVVRQQHLALLTAPPRPPAPHGQAGSAGEVQGA
jgi:uncharacterized RDD family membrane protein YckC